MKGSRYTQEESMGGKEGPSAPISIPRFSLKGQLDTPEGIAKVVKNFVPIKKNSETDDEFVVRLFETIPILRFTLISDRQDRENQLKDLLKRIGYDPVEQKNLRKVLQEELTNNKAFRELVEEFGLPMFISGNGMPGGEPLGGISGYHAAGAGLVVMSKNHVKKGRHESIGSTLEKPKFDTLKETVRHEWFHYLDAVLMASDSKTLDVRKQIYLAGLTQLANDPESVVRKIIGGKDLPKYLEGAILGSIGRQIRAVHPGWSEDKVRIEAMEFFSNELKERRAEFVAQLNDTIDNILFDEDMIDEILRDRGGVLDATAGKYSEYARFGLHELIAEVGRMITSTPAERANPNNNIGKIDDSTVDLLESLFPSISRSQWLNIIRIAYPGIQIKVLRNK